jgi:tetratricopeptide (TPR) repeat protein
MKILDELSATRIFQKIFLKGEQMKKYLPIFLVIIAVLVLAACQSMYMRTARLAIRDEDDPDKAIENLKKEIEANPGNADAYLFMSQIYGQYKEDYYTSYQYAKKALNADPAKEKGVNLIYITTWSQLHNQGLEALNAQNYREAILKLKQAHEIEPDSIMTFELLGDTYVRADSIDKALDIYLQIYDKDPENVFALNRIATTYFNQNNNEKAVEYFLVLHNLEPNKTDWLYNMWVAEIKLGNTEAALNYAIKAVAIDPSNTELLTNIADMQFNQKNYVEAAEYYAKAIDVDPTELETLKYLCYCLSNTKNYTDLVTYSEKWLELEPDSTEAQQFFNLAKQMLNK